MPAPSPAIAAVIRAMHGESDFVALMPALADERLARIIACAPGVHPCVGAVAALCGGLPSVLDESTRADRAFHDALARLIGTPAGRAALRAWAEVAPAGWGHTHMEPLIAAVPATMVDAGVAAALIGACDASAGLLHASRDVAFAIRCWGRSAPAAPTAWADALSAAERKRLTDTALRAPAAVACCLPWLPPGIVNQTRLDDASIGAALDAFAAASSAARTQHAAVLQRLAARTPPANLDTLTRLACAMESKKVWRRVQMLMKGSLGDSWRVVAAASWDDLPKDVRIAILKRADRSVICAAIAAARGKKGVRPITCESSAAFFAALDPAVWDAMDAAAQQRWLHALWRTDVHLAVRSLGLRPEILARAALDSNLARAVHRHAHDQTSWRSALLPVALRDLSPVDAHALIAALPTMPPDPGAFFCIAGMHGDPAIIAPARSALRTPADLAFAVAIGRHGAHDRSWRDALLALLDAPPPHTVAVWQALDDAMRQAIVAGSAAAATLDADPPVIRDPLAVLALAAAHADDADLRATGVAALTARPEMTRTIWAQLPSAVQQDLGTLPPFADLLIAPETPAIRRGRSRGRRA